VQFWFLPIFCTTFKHKSFGDLMDAPKQGIDALFILLGAIMVLAMHAGFAFLELGTVRKKNQVNALVKILVDFSISTVVYFVVGYSVAYGTTFFVSAEVLSAQSGYELVKFFFLLTFAAAIPAIVSGGIAERVGRRAGPLPQARPHKRETRGRQGFGGALGNGSRGGHPHGDRGC
jgi:hypothetical protein